MLARDCCSQVVGIPITPIAIACRRNGVKFVAMRNEQAASYAAGAAGYMTGCVTLCVRDGMPYSLFSVYRSRNQS